MSVVKMRPRTFPEKHPCSRCLKTGSTFDISITHLPGSLAVGLAIWSTPQTPCTGPRAPSLAPVSVGRRRLTAPPFRRLPWLAGAPAPWRDRHPGGEAQSLRQTPGPGRLMLPGLRQSACPPEHRPHPPPRASPPAGPPRLPGLLLSSAVLRLPRQGFVSPPNRQKRPTHLRMPSVENTSGLVPFVRQSLPSRETEGHERQRLCGEWFASA